MTDITVNKKHLILAGAAIVVSFAGGYDIGVYNANMQKYLRKENPCVIEKYYRLKKISSSQRELRTT